MKHKSEIQVFTQLLFLFLAIIGLCCSIEVSLKAPRYVMVNGTAELICNYDVHHNEIHKVDWLRGENKIFQYVRGRNPPYRNFSIIGADIDWEDTNSKKVSLKNLKFDASGVYTCEVTTDFPIYTKPSEEEYLTVVESQLHDPHITFNQANYTVGDILDVNCTSSPATPVPELTWLLNGKKADEDRVRSYPENMHSSSMVQLTMELMDVDFPQIKLTCISTIPGYLGNNVHKSDYADYRAQTIIVDISMIPTEAAQTANASSYQICGNMMTVFFSYVLLKSTE